MYLLTIGAWCWEDDVASKGESVPGPQFRTEHHLCDQAQAGTHGPSGTQPSQVGEIMSKAVKSCGVMSNLVTIRMLIFQSLLEEI